jgi:KaiC/GvpD/RAD55 family RecA-like ATPase
MSTYGWDTAQLEKTGNWKFARLTQSSMVETVIQEMKQHRCIVLDSISELTPTRRNSASVTLLTSMSVQNRESQEIHLILLTEGMQDPTIETAMQHFADGVIVFATTYGSEASTRNMTIKKIRGVTHTTRTLPYSISEKGFTIETAIRIT